MTLRQRDAASFFIRDLDVTGDGSGSKEMAADFTTPDIFFLTPGAGETIAITELRLRMVDNTTLLHTNLGPLTGAQTPGIDIFDVFDDDASATIIDFTQGDEIGTNARLCELFKPESAHPFIGGTQMYVGTMNFGEMFGSPLVLDGRSSTPYQLRFQISENFSTLVGMRITAVGRYISPRELQ